MRPLTLVLAALLGALLAGCGGSDEPPAQPLGERGFASAVAGAVARETDLEAEPGFGLVVVVRESEGPDRLRLSLEQAYARYREDPSRQEALVADLVGEAERRLAEGIDGQSFEQVRADLLPILKPKDAVRRLPGEPARTSFPGDLLVIYAVDTGEQLTLVSSEDLARWEQSPAAIAELALDNLARETEPLLCEPSGDQKLCGWASGDGYDATRMIVPELRRDIVREIGPAVYAVPREDVFVALPVELAPRIEAKVLRDFTTAPNPVSPRLFVERRGELVPLAA